jgi:hypothetical protein
MSVGVDMRGTGQMSSGGAKRKWGEGEKINEAPANNEDTQILKNEM